MFSKTVEFFDSPARNVWVKSPFGEIYLRNGFRSYGGGTVNTMEIASINIKDRFQSHGVFKALIALLREHADRHQRYIYLENVHNERLAQYVREHLLDFDQVLPACYIRPPQLTRVSD